jgi:hypothetical protein
MVLFLLIKIPILCCQMKRYQALLRSNLRAIV